MCLIIDKKKDYYRACKGFTINNIKYRRLLGTNGGIKNSTIVFVSERLYDELSRRIENDRNQDKELVTAKLEAYKALSCSASIPVSFPNGVLVVNDAETEFSSDVIYLTDENDGEPLVDFIKDYNVKLNASDGYGLMHPTLAQRWSQELELDYIVSGVNTRFSFEKGMVFTFDFIDFADKVANNYIVTDAWGHQVDIRDVELILTTSMVKLWDSYNSCEEYIAASIKNKYTFGITKTCPKELENERNLNYQFIQSYNLTDEDIENLVTPTENEIEDVISGDWRKAALFLKGSNMNEENICKLENDYIKAMMIDNRIFEDPFVQGCIYQLIRNRINEAKVGVIKVRGNYSIVSGDPYLLCQSIFGLEKTGLLKSGEIYNAYWANAKSDKLACFRAPMTCHNNIRLVTSACRDDIRYWFRYMNTCTIFNAWDTATAALNGCDFDGDLVMLTDNDVLVKKLTPLPALICAQRKAQKRISTEEDFIKSNIESFGNEIGQTTNWITSMYEIRAGFDENSEEYKTLSYRIQCGQLYQQNSIDKAKGIVCKPMPAYWHDKRAESKIRTEENNSSNISIVAEKKPYFMRYIYPALMKQYNLYIKNTNKNSLREFKKTVTDLLCSDINTLSDREKEFIKYYKLKMPVGINDCVMNKICRRFELKFDGYIKNKKLDNNFDYTIMKSGAEYTARQFNSIKKLYERYNKYLSDYSVLLDYERIDQGTTRERLSLLNEEFKKECSKICPNRFALCDILLDLCYSRSSTKRFVWNMCSDEIIINLLHKNNNLISFPMLDPDGEIEYGGNTFVLKTINIKGDA